MAIGPLIAALSCHSTDDGRAGGSQISFNFNRQGWCGNMACCSQQINKNRRVTYHAPEGAEQPDSPGGTLSIDQESCIVSFFKSCCCCCAAPPLSQEEENAIANKVFLNYLIDTYGFAPALGAIEEFTEKRDRDTHNPQRNPQAPLRVRHINHLHERTAFMKGLVDPFYQNLVQSFRPLIANDELKERDEEALHAIPTLTLPKQLRKPLRENALLPLSPKDCLTLIKAISKGQVKVRNEINC